ncbi:N2227-like protein-domain-containing protein [Apodospora peruviana]|uniref:carnosine N-methyltransferase n=1 Tax=Apodospora peruviana TaxID=516989 RepID=A0AAE0II35_9PEZI|nr:N2227-like protein-domain-containing protein [Apodospora peruviana]
MADETHWVGVEDTIEDPEELRVIFNALDSYLQYGRHAHFNFTHTRRQAFYALPEVHWKRLAAPPFNYLDTLEKVDEAIDSNSELARCIVRTGLPSFVNVPPGQEHPSLPPQWAGCAKNQDIDKARSTIRQFYRDWSAAGASEREACYGPIMRVLLAEKASKSPESGNLKVLVPGAGLGRLVFELCLNGFDTEGNEISYHQLLASAYILNCCERAGQHTVYPWIHGFSNHRSRANQLRGYPVPDVHPSTEFARENPGQPLGTMSMVAADFLCLYSDEAHAETYDAVATVFFLDTAPNLIRYLETIFHCLKPGGMLVNNGPLLWHFENSHPGSRGDADGETDTTGIADPGTFELTDDEVMALVQQVGFEVLDRQTGLEAPYIHDAESMLQTVYRASSWMARKPLTAVRVKNNATANEPRFP